MDYVEASKPKDPTKSAIVPEPKKPANLEINGDIPDWLTNNGNRYFKL